MRCSTALSEPIGLIKEQTGSVIPGLFALAAASTIAAGLVYFVKERRSGKDSGPEIAELAATEPVPSRA